VVFDRIRKTSNCCGGPVGDIVNKSINQTLSRTILTAGLTFLTVLALFLFGARCCAFQLCVVVGILIGRILRLRLRLRFCGVPGMAGEKGKTPIAMPLRSGNGGTQPKEKAKSKTRFLA